MRRIRRWSFSGRLGRVAAYDPAEWTDLFVAMAGASAALAGLVFVAVSINVERILQYAGLPERALQTLCSCSAS